jgi:hypothetical protein
MASKLSPAQRANQITFFLKGDLKPRSPTSRRICFATSTRCSIV